MTLHLHVGYTASLSSPDIPADWLPFASHPLAAFAAVVLRATDHQALARLNASALPLPVFVIGHLEYTPESQLKITQIERLDAASLAGFRPLQPSMSLPWFPDFYATYSPMLRLTHKFCNAGPS